GAPGGDASVLDQHVLRFDRPCDGIDQPATRQQQAPAHPRTPPRPRAGSATGSSPMASSALLRATSRYRSAIRTASPLVTWFMMTEYGPSATALEISSPRFGGPGWRMITSGFARRTISSVRQ